MRLIAAILIIFTLSACNKPDPNPELKDPIYSDLQAQLGSTSAALEAEKKKLEGFQKDVETVIPQTGQVKYAKKRFFESETRVAKLQQEEEFLKLKIEQRKKAAVLSYKKAFEKKEAWPDPKEYSSYQAEQKLRTAKREWDVKQRLKDAGMLPTGGEKGKSEGEGAEKKEEAKKE